MSGRPKIPMGVGKKSGAAVRAGAQKTPASVRLDWSDLQLFYEIARAGSIGAAAKAMGNSQPTISQHLRSMEERFGAQLFVRRREGLVLTEVGERIRGHVETMHQSALTIDRVARAHDARNEGRVKLSVTDAMAAFWLSPRLPDFQRLNPDITLSVNAGLWPAEALRDEVDLSLQFDECRDPDFVVTTIATVHYAAFASRSYLDLYGRPKTDAELASHRTIHHVAQTRQAETWDPTVTAIRTLWRADVETNSSAMTVAAARSGAGIAFLPTFFASLYHELEMVGDKPYGSLKLWLVYRQDIARIERVRRVLGWLRELYCQDANPWFRTEFVHPSQFPTPLVGGPL